MMNVNFDTMYSSSRLEKSVSDVKSIGDKSERIAKDFESTLHAELGKIKAEAKPVDKKLMDSCVEMESLFVNQMYKAMRKNVEKGEMLHGGQAEEIFEDMLYDQYSLEVSKKANLGLAKQLYDQLSCK